MTESKDFEIRYVSPGELRSGQYDSLLIYKDAQGKLTFNGYEHHPDYMVYVPSAPEWDSELPARTGQREVVAARLVSHFRGQLPFESIRRSINDPDFFAAFPEVGARLRNRRETLARLASLKGDEAPPRPPWWTVFVGPVLVVGLVTLLILYGQRAYRRSTQPVLMTETSVKIFEGIDPSASLYALHEGKKVVKVDPAALADHPELQCEERGASGRSSEYLLANELALSMIETSPRTFPVGSIIYKQLESSPGKARARVVGMRKREAGYDPANADWSYLTGTSYGAYDTGRVDRCIACHSKAAANDYVFNLADPSSAR